MDTSWTLSRCCYLSNQWESFLSWIVKLRLHKLHISKDIKREKVCVMCTRITHHPPRLKSFKWDKFVLFQFHFLCITITLRWCVTEISHPVGEVQRSLLSSFDQHRRWHGPLGRRLNISTVLDFKFSRAAMGGLQVTVICLGWLLPGSIWQAERRLAV